MRKSIAFEPAEISMDPLPAHPAQAFLPSFMYAQERANCEPKSHEI